MSRSAPATRPRSTRRVAALRAKGVTAHGEALDVADKAALEAWVADAATALGGIDIVVANVSALDMADTEEAWRHEFEIDLMHTVRTVNAAMPWLEKSEAPAIVIVSSVSGPRGRLHQPGLRRDQGGADPLRAGTRLQARRQDDPGELGLARQYLFRRRHLAVDREEQPGAVRAGPGAEPDRPHGDRRRRSRAAWCSWRARPPASPPAPTSSSTARLTKGVQF